jgi:hypothetical protein
VTATTGGLAFVSAATTLQASLLVLAEVTASVAASLAALYVSREVLALANSAAPAFSAAAAFSFSSLYFLAVFSLVKLAFWSLTCLPNLLTWA